MRRLRPESDSLQETPGRPGKVTTADPFTPAPRQPRPQSGPRTAPRGGTPAPFPTGIPRWMRLVTSSLLGLNAMLAIVGPVVSSEESIILDIIWLRSIESPSFYVHLALVIAWIIMILYIIVQWRGMVERDYVMGREWVMDHIKVLSALAVVQISLFSYVWLLP